MKNKLLKLIIHIVLIAALVMFLMWKRSPVLTSSDEKIIITPGVYTSMKYDDLRKLMPKRIEYIKSNSTFLEPYDKNKLQLISDKMGTATGEQIVSMMTAVPNGELGYYRVDPSVSKEPSALSSFQFEQGMTGWFWIYGTFIDSTGATASFMYYLVRLDMFPPDLRKELGLPMGSTTYYYIVGGVGKGDKWSYTTFKLCRGEYNIKSDSVFSFTSLDLPDGWKYTLQMNGRGKFNIAARWIDDSAKAQGFTIALTPERQAFFNGPEGCAPCSGGAGTMYFSYTQLTSSGTLLIDSVEGNYSNGTSWVDRQWLNRQVSSVYLSLLSNISSLFEAEARGLGKYVWLNLHLGKDLQYMVSGLFGTNDVVTKGTKFSGITDRYPADNKTEINISSPVTVLDTVVLQGIGFPIKYEIITKDGKFILDGSKFPKSLSIDPSNNYHWNSSGIIYDTTGKMVGTGFLEANQFTPNDLYITNLLKTMGIDATKENIQLFSASKLTFAQTLPNIIAAAIAVLGILILFILFIRGLFKKSK